MVGAKVRSIFFNKKALINNEVKSVIAFGNDLKFFHSSIVTCSAGMGH